MGRRGEREAADHLKRLGYTILERNYRIRQGEIDLVAFRDGVLAFVEVRAQTEPAMVDALYTITRRKQRRIIKAAQTYVALNAVERGEVELRFDVVAVLFNDRGQRRDIRHIEGAFQETPKGFT
ncbi:MAG: hypothetical protein AMK73_00335 [Planctomycetes bacterium SM23_32]|nr:MAG: hypothetical protein AMK73_00335 [Planctomycetes bacterium SM23_32]